MLPNEPPQDASTDRVEAALVERMRAGDRDAAVTYIWARRDEILSIARRTIRPDDHVDRDPEDIFSTMLRRWDRIVGKGLFTAKNSNEATRLLFAMMHRTIANVFRRGKVRRDNAHRSVVDEEVLDRMQDFDRGALRSIVAALKADEYDLLVCKMQGMRSAEIAVRLGITDENVRRRWHDLRHKLLAQLLGSN
ncbi:MAG: sigma-70 family RNA polymerase sigma factor [Phycisphaerae bacterium]|nr:sigma-70 family RNA polymerase sigma factor [Phycisphaerae bacterium]